MVVRLQDGHEVDGFLILILLTRTITRTSSGPEPEPEPEPEQGRMRDHAACRPQQLGSAGNAVCQFAG